MRRRPEAEQTKVGEESKSPEFLLTDRKAQRLLKAAFCNIAKINGRPPVPRFTQDHAEPGNVPDYARGLVYRPRHNPDQFFADHPRGTISRATMFSTCDVITLSRDL